MIRAEPTEHEVVADGPAPGVARWLLLGNLVAMGLHIAGTAWFVTAPSLVPDAPLLGFPSDDAWIHMVYGRSLAQAGVPAYNGALEPGFSSPLWLCFTAAAHLLSPAQAVLLVKGMGLLLAAVTGLLIGALLARLRIAGRPLPAALIALAPIWVAVEPYITFGKLSGMEVALTSALLAGLAHSLVAGRMLAAGLLFAGAYLARPECLVLAPLVALGSLGAGTWKAALSRLARLALPSMAAASAWAAACMSASGRPLPTTAYLKTTSLVDTLSSLAAGGWGLIDDWSLVGHGLGLPLLAAGTLAPLVACRHRRRDLSRLGFTLLAPWLFLLAILLTRIIRDPDGFYFSRYALPALPLLLPPLLLGAAWARQRLPRIGKPAAAALIGLLLLLAAPALLYQRNLYGSNCGDIHRLNVETGRAIARLTPPDAVIGTYDAGAIHYFGGRETHDLYGLNSWRFAFEETRRQAFEDAHFTHLALTPVMQPWHRARLQSLKLRRLHRARVAHNTLVWADKKRPYRIDLYAVE